MAQNEIMYRIDPTGVNAMVAQSVAATGRIPRNPSHTFSLQTRPFVLQPFMLAPVLPGETLETLLLQSRCVTDPIKNRLVGWWKEYYFFYVKHRDLTARDDLMQMMLDPTVDLAALRQTGAHSTPYYTFNGAIKWGAMCMERVVDEYFRDEDEQSINGAITNLLDGMPLAHINAETWLESAKTASSGDDDEELPGHIDDDTVVTGYTAAFQQWQFMRSHKMTDMDYDDYLKSFGIRIKEETVEEYRPELIRYIRDWSYPTNTVEPTTGIPSSAVSWAIAERADKKRFFKEPGFIIGITVTRPKVFMTNIKGSGVGMMDNALKWLPPTAQADPYTSLVTYNAASGPIPNVTEAYWVDIRDLFIYGDQYVNYALTAADSSVSLPTNTMGKYYPTSADIDNLFTAVANNKVEEDGVVSLKILGHQWDTT